MRNKKIIAIVLFVLLFLVGCTKDGDSDSKENVESMVKIHQNLVKASDDAHQVVQQIVMDYKEEDMSYETLKNILKEHQSVQVSLKKGVQEQATTPYRKHVSAYFEAVMNERIEDYDLMLGLVRQKDAEALKILGETLKEKETETKASLLVSVNESLKEKDVKALDALEK